MRAVLKGRELVVSNLLTVIHKLVISFARICNGFSKSKRNYVFDISREVHTFSSIMIEGLIFRYGFFVASQNFILKIFNDNLNAYIGCYDVLRNITLVSLGKLGEGLPVELSCFYLSLAGVAEALRLSSMV